MLQKCVLTVLELKWNQRLGHKENKIELLLWYAHVVHTTAKQVISRRRKNENDFKMSKNEKYTCKACKNTNFHCQIRKFVGFLLPLSSWLLKLPNSPRCVTENGKEMYLNIERMGVGCRARKTHRFCSINMQICAKCYPSVCWTSLITCTDQIRGPVENDGT